MIHNLRREIKLTAVKTYSISDSFHFFFKVPQTGRRHAYVAADGIPERGTQCQVGTYRLGSGTQIYFPYIPMHVPRVGTTLHVSKFGSWARAKM